MYSYSLMICFFIYFWNVKPVDGAAETRSFIGHYRRFGTTYLPHPRCRTAQKSAGLIYFAAEDWNHAWSFLVYYNKLLCIDCFIVMYWVVGQLLPTFRETTLRNVGRNSTTDTAAQLAPQQHRCENVKPQHPAPIQLKASNADAEGIGKRGGQNDRNYGNARFAGLRALGLLQIATNHVDQVG
jgi:hypothetical protein